ncbi:hypothetical protein D9M69_622320 [compost metagenome]
MGGLVHVEGADDRQVGGVADPHGDRGDVLSQLMQVDPAMGFHGRQHRGQVLFWVGQVHFIQDGHIGGFRIFGGLEQQLQEGGAAVTGFLNRVDVAQQWAGVVPPRLDGNDADVGRVVVRGAAQRVGIVQRQLGFA